MEVLGGNIDFNGKKIVFDGNRGRNDFQPFKGEVEVPLALRASFFSFCYKVLTDADDIPPAEFRGSVKLRMFALSEIRNGYVAGILVSSNNISTKFLLKKHHVFELLYFFGKLSKVTTVADVFLIEKTDEGIVKINQEEIPEEVVNKLRLAIPGKFYLGIMVNGKPFRVGKIISYGDLKAPLDDEGRIRLWSVVGV